MNPHHEEGEGGGYTFRRKGGGMVSERVKRGEGGRGEGARGLQERK